MCASSFAVLALDTDLSLVEQNHAPQAEHVDQADLVSLVINGQDHEAFVQAFEMGDELFEAAFNAVDGVGANIGNGQRFTRVPRADLNGPGEWANHFPERPTGPSAESCVACHREPEDDGAGRAETHAHRDPFHTADLGQMIQRNTPHLFAPGALQRLAEEMTEELQAIRAEAEATACETGDEVVMELVAKGVPFGIISAVADKRGGGGDRRRRNHGRRKGECVAVVDTSGIEGINADLVVRPFQWKGSETNLRAFNRDAAHREIGMQPVELVGSDTDGDFDGVLNEMTVGDITALAIYLAAQPRPTTLVELAQHGLIPPDVLAADSISRGEQQFVDIGCGQCHTQELTIDNPIFSEPSENEHYRDETFPGGQDPVVEGVDPAFAVTFDLTQDQPDNIITDAAGNTVFHMGVFQTDDQNRAIVALYGDMKRHDMGPGLAENIDEEGTGASVFLTENLWGVGSTAPYLHDGRATTLTEAILEHGGEAAAARDAFIALSSDAQQDIIVFMDNLVLFKIVVAE